MKQKHNQDIVDRIVVLNSLGFKSREISHILFGNNTQKSTVNDILNRHKQEQPHGVLQSPMKTTLDNPDLQSLNTHKAKKILFIPDCQVKEGEDLFYLHAIGQYIVDKKPDIVVNAGDFFDFPSLSSYDKGKLSFEGKRLRNDIAVGQMGMQMLLKPLREYQKKDPSYQPRLVFTLGNHECLTEDSEVLTQTGFKTYLELTEFDQVLTLTPEGFGEWNKPALVFEKEYKGNLHSYDSRSFSSLNTTGHRMLYKTSGGKLKFKESKDLGKNFKVITSVSSRNKGVSLSDQQIQLAGWLCTDSYFTKSGEAVLYQRKSNAHKIRNLLNELDIEYSEKHRNRDIKEICGKPLLKRSEVGVEFYLKTSSKLLDIGVTTNKKLPSWVSELTDAQWDTFLDVLIDADGSIPTKAVKSRVFYGQKEICNDLQIQASLHGWSASITEYREGQWRVNLMKQKERKQENLFLTEVPYDGKVWCMTVKNENFFIRRKGKCHFTGNCRLMRVPENNSEFEGFVGYHLLELDRDWEVHDFLKPVNIQGINFVHYLANPMTGKPYGGSAVNQLKSVGSSFCVGHKQTLDVAIQPVLDGAMRIGIIAGASYPFDEGYKGYAGNNHFRGVVMLHDAKDGYADPSFISTKFLISRLHKGGNCENTNK